MYVLVIIILEPELVDSCFPSIFVAGCHGDSDIRTAEPASGAQGVMV